MSRIGSEFSDYQRNAKRQALQYRFKSFKLPLLVFGILFLGVVTYGIQLFISVADANVQRREDLLKKRYKSQYYELYIEGQPSSRTKSVDIFYKPKVLLAEDLGYPGYGFYLPRMLNGQEIIYSFGKHPAEFGKLELKPLNKTLYGVYLRTEEPVITKGESELEFSLTIPSASLQDDKGFESLRWSFPDPHNPLLVDNLNVVIFLPSYASASGVNAEGIISRYISYSGGEGGEPRLYLLSQRAEKVQPTVRTHTEYNPSRVTVSFMAEKLEPHESLDVSIRW